MIYYPPTPVPPSLPYADLHGLISVLCDRCLFVQEATGFSERDKLQFFEFTMALITFWEGEEILYGLPQR